MLARLRAEPPAACTPPCVLLQPASFSRRRFPRDPTAPGQRRAFRHAARDSLYFGSLNHSWKRFLRGVGLKLLLNLKAQKRLLEPHQAFSGIYKVLCLAGFKWWRKCHLFPALDCSPFSRV